MTTLHLDLLRHGETEQGGGLRGSLDDALTDQGWEQMRQAVLGRGPWCRLVSSPLQRCARCPSSWKGICRSCILEPGKDRARRR